MKDKAQLWCFLEVLHLYLCEVLQPWWDTDWNVARPAERRRGDCAGMPAVLRSWSGTRLVHDNRRLAWVIVRVEAWRRGLRVSVPTWARRVRGHHLAPVVSHGVRRLVGRARITWKTGIGIKSFSEVLIIPFPAVS